MRSRPPMMAALHWVTAALLAVGLTAILTRELIEARAARGLLLEVHRWCGLLVFAVAVCRVLQRTRIAHLPDLLPQRSRHARILAGAVHVLLYVLMMAVPIVGWCLISSDDEDVADRLHLWHVALACTFLFLVAVHAAAACWHQFIRREPVVRAMWPWPLFTEERGDIP